jgi:hypothetical protein
VINSTNPVNNVRLFQKSGQVKGRRVFIMDYLDTIATGDTPANTFAHYRSKGWNISFTDGSVGFSKPDPATYANIVAGNNMASMSGININYLPILEDNAK